MTDRLKSWGVALAVMAALLYSAKAIFVKLAYQYDVDSITLLALRMLTALPVYLIVQLFYGIARESSAIRTRHWVEAGIAAFLGHYLASFLDFWGLQFVEASIERLILFTYPTFIVLIARLWLKEPITTRQLVAIALSYLGLILVFVPQMEDLSLDSQFMTGVLAILACAVAFAIYMIMSQRLIPSVGTTRYTNIAMIFACMFVLGHYRVARDWGHILEQSIPVYYYGAAMGIIATVLPSYFMNHAIQRIGASRTGIIASIGPVSTIVLAYIFLDERLVAIQWLGAAFIISAVTFISVERRRTRRIRATAARGS